MLKLRHAKYVRSFQQLIVCQMYNRRIVNTIVIIVKKIYIFFYIYILFTSARENSAHSFLWHMILCSFVVLKSVTELSLIHEYGWDNMWSSLKPPPIMLTGSHVSDFPLGEAQSPGRRVIAPESSRGEQAGNGIQRRGMRLPSSTRINQSYFVFICFFFSTSH